MHYLFQHIDLLARYDRSIGLLKAIREFVKEDETVLDAGCGPGLLSILAKKAGAKSVLGVDIDKVEPARGLAACNNLSEGISFLQADLNKADLAEHAPFDSMMAMIYLNDPRRDEKQQDLVFALKDKFLKRGGRLFPDRVTYEALACDWPKYDIVTKDRIVAERVKTLEGQYQLSFKSLFEDSKDHIDRSFFPARSTKDGTVLGQGDNLLLSDYKEVFAVDYSKDSYAYPKSIALDIAETGRFNNLIWVQKIWYQNILIFRNESASFVETPKNVKSGETVEVILDDRWRQTNRVKLK